MFAQREFLKNLTVVAAAAVALSGCASTEMRTYVGRSIDETMIAYGQPENVFELQDGRRAYQYRWGGGSGMVPASSFSTLGTIGNTAAVRTTATPAMIFESSGCLITFIARQGSRGYVIEEYRVPRQLVC